MKRAGLISIVALLGAGVASAQTPQYVSKTTTATQTMSGPLAAPVINAAQIAGQGSNTTIQNAVTHAGTSGSVRVPTSFPSGEMASPANILSESLAATSSYAPDALFAPVEDDRMLNAGAAAMQGLSLDSLDAESEGGSTAKLAQCIASGGPCPIALVGHSVAENINDIGPDDSGLQTLAEYLNRKFPGVFTFYNFSITGASVENFVDPTYLCEPSGANTFYRALTGSWYSGGANVVVGPPFLQWPAGCSTGVDWEGQVSAVNPVAVIFGLSLNSYGVSNAQFAADLQTAITWAQDLGTTPTVILETDLLPNFTSSPEAGDDPNGFESLMQVTRALAEQDNLLLVDADRRFQMMRNGFDVTRMHSQVEQGFNSWSTNGAFPSYPTGWQAAPSFSGTMPPLTNSGALNAALTVTNGMNALVVQRNRYAWDVTETAVLAVGATGGTGIMGFRDDPTTGNGYYLEATANTSTSFTVTLYWAPNGLGGGGSGAITTTTCTGGATAIQLTIRTDGGWADMYCGAPGSSTTPTHFYHFYDYHKIYPGVCTFGFTSTGGSVYSEFIEYRNPEGWNTPLNTTIALMGGLTSYYTDPNSYGGNNNRHPGGVGMDAIYLAAWGPALNAIERDGKIAISAGALGSAQSSLASSNVTMTTPATFYDGPTTGSIAAGTWLVTGTVSLQTTSLTAAVNFTCKLWDGTTTFTTSGQYIELTAAAAAKAVPVTLSAIAAEASPATIKISCESDTASQLISYQTAYGTLANASSISAIRIK
jgi:hypothetical protein